MVRRDDPTEKVRPLTPGDGVAQEHAVRVRPSLGIAIGAGAVVLLLVLVVFGAGGGNYQTGIDPESETAADVADNVQTPPTTLPAELSQLIPVEADQLVAVSRSGARANAGATVSASSDAASCLQFVMYLLVS